MVDINLSRDEDSVTSLAVAQSSKLSAIAFAGINSSEADQKAGQNEHLRSFKLAYPPQRGENSELEKESAVGQKENTEALGRTALFTPSTAIKKETYQRILRLSRAHEDSSSRLGAIATGLAPEGEVVVFDAIKTEPGQSDVLGRVNLGEGVEAADVDVIHVNDGNYQVAYCTNHEVYIVKIFSSKKNQPSNPQFCHEIPHPDTFASSNVRPKFRSIRFLTSNLLLLLQNQPNGKGAELLVLELPKLSSLGTITLRKRLHRSIKSATNLSVALLTTSQPSQSIQQAIAVAGQDNSVSILTLDHPSSPPFPSIKFRSYAFLPLIHPLQITSLTFSTFHPPSDGLKAPPQYLKLASTSIASTLVIHTFPLTSFRPNSNPTSPPHYILRQPGRSETTQITLSVIVSAIAIALGAFFLQAFTEIRGGTPEYLGAKGWLSERVHGYIARPYMFEDLSSAISSSPVIFIETKTTPTESTSTIYTEPDSATQTRTSPNPKPRLRDLLSQHSTPTDLSSSKNNDDNKNDEPFTTLNSQQILISTLADHSLAIDLHDPSRARVPGKRWDELEEAERERWKSALIKAGEWAVEEGEAVLKGVFFSGWAGVVGEVVAGVVGD